MRSLALLVAAVAAALIVAAPAEAARNARFGIQDDAWLTSGPYTLEARLDRLDWLGVDVVRYTLHWDQIAVERPEQARDPHDPAYRWATPASVLEGLRRRNIAALVTLLGTPSWANGDAGWNRHPSSSTDFGSFAYAASKRFPWVRDWLIWNEPNLARFLRPTTPTLYVQRLLNPAYRELHAADSRNRVGGGVSAPRANGGLSPVAWIRGLRAAGARLDAYAHHPYPANRLEAPSSGGCSNRRCKTITMANIDLLLAEVRRAWGAKPIWLTEYGYQTNPPDRLGVSEATQARYVAEAAAKVRRLPSVTMLIHFLIQDDVLQESWQSGLYTSTGRPKLAALAFPLPLAQVERRGLTTTIWGQVRRRAGRQTYRVQVRPRGGRWSWRGGVRQTDARGEVHLTVQAGRGARLRLYTPRDRAYSLVLTVR